MTIRVNLDETGHLRFRRLPIGDAARIGRATLERAAQILQAVAERGQLLIEPHMAALTTAVPLLEQSTLGRTAAAPLLSETPEIVLMLLRDPTELNSLYLFNHLIDFYVNGVEDGLSSAMVGPRRSDRVQSATILHDHLFGAGKGFLSLSNLKQWHHIHVAFNRMSDEHLEVARKAGVAEEIGWVQALNAYFARMLRIDLNNIDALLEHNPELDKDPTNDNITGALTATLEALMGLTQIAGALWPNPAQSDLRRVLCGLYLDEIQRQSAIHSKLVRASRNPAPPVPPAPPAPPARPDPPA